MNLDDPTFKHYVTNPTTYFHSSSHHQHSIKVDYGPRFDMVIYSYYRIVRNIIVSINKEIMT